jgi:hypothetical protein
MANTARDRDAAGRNLAKTFCLVAGATLVLVGLLGFLVDSTFDTGNGVDGENLIIFEVNGWENLVHIATGAFLLLGARDGRTAATVATVFGLVYLIVTIYGFVDGNDIIRLLPIDVEGNVLHLLLALSALAVGLSAGGLMGSRDAAGPGGTTRAA